MAKTSRIVELVDGGLQCLAGVEANHTPLRDLDCGPRLRVTRGAGLSLRGLESSKADERDRLTLLQRLGDAFEEGVDGRCGARLRDARVLRDLRNEILLIHDASGLTCAKAVYS